MGSSCTTERQYSAIKSYHISIPDQPPSEYMTPFSSFFKPISPSLSNNWDYYYLPVCDVVNKMYQHAYKGRALKPLFVQLRTSKGGKKEALRNYIRDAKGSEDSHHPLLEWCNKPVSSPGLAERVSRACLPLPWVPSLWKCSVNISQWWHRQGATDSHIALSELLSLRLSENSLSNYGQ